MYSLSYHENCEFSRDFLVIITIVDVFRCLHTYKYIRFSEPRAKVFTLPLNRKLTNSLYSSL